MKRRSIAVSEAKKVPTSKEEEKREVQIYRDETQTSLKGMEVKEGGGMFLQERMVVQDGRLRAGRERPPEQGWRMS